MSISPHRISILLLTVNLAFNHFANYSAYDRHLHFVSKSDGIESHYLADKERFHVLPLFFEVFTAIVLISQLLMIESSIVVPFAAVAVFEAPFAHCYHLWIPSDYSEIHCNI